MMQLGFSPIRVLVGNISTAWKAAGTTISSYADLTDGQMAHVSPNNITLNPATAITSATGPTRIVVRNGNKLVYSDWISQAAADATSVLSVTKPYSADTQQVTYLGYNGTSGALDVFHNTEYIINLKIEDEDVATYRYPYMKHGVYLSDSTATGAEIALGLVSSLNANFAREHQTKIEFDAVCDAAYNALYGTKTGQEITVVKGSKVLLFETDLTYLAAGTETIVVGDYLRFGTWDATTQTHIAGTPAVTSPVYRVESISGLYVTLDRPVTSATDVYEDVAAIELQVIPAATGDAANWGIKMVGIARTNFVPGEQKHDVTKFKVELTKGWESTVVTYSTAGALGVGTYEEVAEMEWSCQGNAGKLVTLGVPMFKSRSAADETKVYTRTMYTYIEPGNSGIITNTPNKTKTLYIYTAQTDASTTGQANADVAAVL